MLRKTRLSRSRERWVLKKLFPECHTFDPWPKSCSETVVVMTICYLARTSRQLTIVSKTQARAIVTLPPNNFKLTATKRIISCRVESRRSSRPRSWKHLTWLNWINSWTTKTRSWAVWNPRSLVETTSLTSSRLGGLAITKPTNSNSALFRSRTTSKILIRNWWMVRRVFCSPSGTQRHQSWGQWATGTMITIALNSSSQMYQEHRP